MKHLHPKLTVLPIIAPSATVAPTVTVTPTATVTPTVTVAPTATPETAKNKKWIAITVDDGPDGAGTTSFIELAEELDIPLTFFVVGQNIDKNSAQLKEMLNAGCEIGNHSMTHCYLNELDSAGVKQEIEKTNELIAKYVPEAQVRLVRAPYFAYSDVVYESVGYPLIDASLCEAENNLQETLDILLGAYDGDIVLMHTWNKASCQALKEAVPLLREAGFEFATVSQLLEIKNVEPVDGIVYRKVKKNLSAEYWPEKNLFNGTGSASGDWSNWTTAVELKAEDVKALKESKALAVTYMSGAGPCLILQSWSGGPGWVQIIPSSDSGTVALFTYEDIVAAYGGELSSLNAALIRPYGADLTVTEVNMMSK